ncbi:MAG TPA: hypothetical protein DDZ96_03715 [Porphyromonadaceae bacterium]|jgi:uncharacterized protein YqeY|uniref:hypothetical protein n=1 Tax=Limibacterium fermenti TaxID=3229863 RepID=UPI000E99B32E|nr:hypothetical protein [Porphyromonadaceae bacterium]HBK31183.1 hypothetical protein [Porphyromonadaceae bacterium]HBL32913.1 hypothetical protein [Porphyromonadaceae bacterium]HBX19487.1 hypothetical protein [Porphyromonadaceae bacterium]HBX46548.1 hypothetical protein [Porphyromonadaceae bacterium]
MKKVFASAIKENDVHRRVASFHSSQDMTDKEILEIYKHLNTKVEKIGAAFKKNKNGKLTDDELNEALRY